MAIDRLAEDKVTLARIEEAVDVAGSVPVNWASLAERNWGSACVEALWNQPLKVCESLGHAFDTDLVQQADSAGHTRIRRQDLFALAATLDDRPSEPELVRFVVNVNAWGYGTSGYAEYRTRTVLGDPDSPRREQFVASALQGLAILREHGPVAAYYWFNNGNQGHVPSWGPAFFTKFLYFADPRNQPDKPGGALILDQRIDQRVHEFVAGDTPLWPRHRRGTWRTPHYASYLALLQRFAEHTGVDQPRSDRVEAVLFRPDPGNPQLTQGANT